MNAIPYVDRTGIPGATCRTTSFWPARFIRDAPGSWSERRKCLL